MMGKVWNIREALLKVASLKIAVYCLVLLFVLTVLGTLYQVEHGLYASQQKFFNSWGFLLGGFFPFPGAQLVLWVFFFNLMASVIAKMSYHWTNLGNVLIHWGIIVLLVGSFVTHYYAQESYLALEEGQGSNVSVDYRKWELSLWPNPQHWEKKVTAYSLEDMEPGMVLDFSELGMQLRIDEVYVNAKPLSNAEDPHAQQAAPYFEKLPEYSDDKTNVPGLVVTAMAEDGKERQVFALYGGRINPVTLTKGADPIFASIRRKRYQLPLYVKLVDFKKEEHPGTRIASNFESVVDLHESGVSRRDRIFMNNPLRFDTFTFFQSSYSQAGGKETTVLAVVDNAGKWLPYVSSLIVFAGFLFHFLKMLILFVLRKERGYIRKNGHFDEDVKGRPLTQLQTVETGVSTNVGKGIGAVLLVSAMGLGVAPVKAETSFPENLNYDEFRKVLIQHEGRLKPLDTYARVTLLQFSSKSSFQKRPAIEWMARVFFEPEKARADKVFRINNPEVLYALDVDVEKGHRYSFLQLGPSFSKISHLAGAAAKVDEKKRTPVEKEILRLNHNLSEYLGLMEAFRFAAPQREFAVQDASLAMDLGVAAGKPNTYLRIREALSTLPDKETFVHGAGESFTQYQKDVAALTTSVMEWSRHYAKYPPDIVPPATGDGEWQSPWHRLALQSAEGGAWEGGYDWAGAMAAYRADKPFEFSQAVLAHNRKVAAVAPIEAEKKAGYELLLNSLDPFYLSKLCYGFSLLALLFSLMFWRRFFYWASALLLMGGLVPHAIGMGLRTAITGRPPTTNLFETFVFVGFSAALLGLFLERFQRKGLGLMVGSFSGLALLLISLKYAFEGDTMRVLVAVLDSNFWLTTHVITISLGYAGMCVAGVIGHVYMIQAMTKKSTPARLTSTYKMIFGTLAFGFLFSFVGTVLGGIWADQSWGRFWGWDPKENGALLIVLWGAILFHAKLAKMIGPLGMAVGSVLGIIIVMMAWFGINLLGVGLHSYGFTSGVATALVAYCLSELVFVGALYPFARRRLDKGAELAAA